MATRERRSLTPGGISGDSRNSSRAGTPGTLRRRAHYRSQMSVISFQSDPTRPPQYFILNPMHVVNLTADKTKSFGIRMAQKIKAFSEKWFSHVLLLTILLVYAAAGAHLFVWLEEDYEIRQKHTIINFRNLVINRLASTVRTHNSTQWYKDAQYRVMEYEEQIRTLRREAYLYTPSDKKVWTFWGALFYCSTLFTTIGYGNIAPSTTAGKIATIFYGIIGIPLLLMVLADLGKLFTRWIKWFFFLAKHFYRTGTCAKKSHDKSGPVQYVAFVWQKVNDKMTYVPYPAYMKPKSKVSEEGETGTDVESRKADTEAGQSDGPEDFEAEVDEEFNLPVTVALIILSLYMTAGAILFTFWERWDFTNSFYFVFISMSTVGFGDLVPEHPIFMMATFIYLLFGLALTSMCINVVQEKLSAIFQKAKMQLGTTIGFDPSMLAEEVIDEEFEDEEEEDALAGGLPGPVATVGSIAPPSKKQAPGSSVPKVPEKLAPKGSDRKKSIAGGGRRNSKAPKKPEINIDELIKSGKGVDATKNMQSRQ